MVGYPYTYGDQLSEQEAMRRRVELFDKGILVILLWGFNAAFSNAQEPMTPPNPLGEAPKGQPNVFAPVAAVCTCTSPQVKTVILLSGIGDKNE